MQHVKYLSATESRTTNATYNAAGQLDTVTDAANHLFTLEYYPASDPVEVRRRLKAIHRGNIVSVISSASI